MKIFPSATWQMMLMGLRYLNGRRLRTALTTLAIVFGVALIFAINLALPSVMDLFKQTLTSVNGADLTLTHTANTPFSAESIANTVASVPQVESVVGILKRQITLPKLGGELGETSQIELIGIDPVQSTSARDFVMSEGRFLEAGDSGKAVLPAGIASLAPQLTVGSTFPLVTSAGLKLYTIIGFTAEQGNLTSPEIYVSLSDAQIALNQPNLINTIEVYLKSNVDAETARVAILDAVGSEYQIDAVSNLDSVGSAMQASLAFFNLLGFLALFLGAFLIFNTFRTVIIERRRDLGMLRAIGATQFQITLMIVLESIVQGVIGTLIGLVAGYGLTLAITGFVNSYAQEYFNRGTLDIGFSLSAVVIASTMGILTAVIAGYLPARAAAHISPLEALRPSPEAKVNRAARWSLIGGGLVMALGILLVLSGTKGAVGGSMLFLIGTVIASPSLIMPMARLFSPILTLWFAREGDLARGNLTRQPGRAAITASTLMIGVAVFIVMAAVVDSMGSFFTKLATQQFSSDVMLVPQTIAIYDNIVGADEQLSSRLKSIPDVSAVASLRYATSSIEGNAVQVLGIDPVAYPQVASFQVSQGNIETALADLGTGRNALLTSIALSTLKLNLGDQFELQTADGLQTYTVAGVANDVFTVKLASIFISQANLATDFRKTEDVLLMLNLQPNADKASALSSINEVLKEYPQFTARLTSEYRDEMLETTNGALVLFYALAFIILIPSALGLLNTLTINILERTREIGVVRAVGSSRGQVRRIVSAEALLLGIFGASLGVITGVILSYGFISVFGTVGWDLNYSFPLMGIVAGVVIGILLALFASILPARSAAQLDIIRALQYE